MSLVLSRKEIEQSPLVNANLKCELTVAVSSLSIGGAERIVLDWAARIYPRWRVHLIVLRNRDKEWQVPSFIRVTRVTPMGKNSFKKDGGAHVFRLQELRRIGDEIAQSNNPICTCHLLRKDERDAIASSGTRIVTVLHNARDGWVEGVDGLVGSDQVIAVSDACAKDVRSQGWQGPLSVIRHIPSRPTFISGAREKFRNAWNIPADATVIGMIGAVKRQKNYTFAISVLKELLKKKNAYLVIVGGPVNDSDKGRIEWMSVIDEIHQQGVRNRVAMPGFIPDGSMCLPAFDVLLNTSHFEGLSIATLEALMTGLPVVATKVGGQGELSSEGLTLLSPEAHLNEWVESLLLAMSIKPSLPPWQKFGSHKLWTLAGLARPFELTDKVLFVTANLNSGGAQRSLVNLSLSLQKENFPFSVVVGGNSTEDYFFTQLKKGGVSVERLTDNGDAFANTDALIYKICSEQFGTVCFWNVDSKMKLLIVKALGFTNVRFIDVSPGKDSFDRLSAITEFQQLIAFSNEELYQRLDKVVLKYDGFVPETCFHKTLVIPNGIPEVSRVKSDYSVSANPKVVVNGRIAPTKFLREILQAMRLVRKKIPSAELHVFGGAEPLQQEYAEHVYREAEAEIGQHVFFYGPHFEVTSQLADFDAYVVLGKDQGCPNALLEALACGLPSIANDDGGTREQLIHQETGLLISECSPELLADALVTILTDRVLAKCLGTAGRRHVMKNFSMRDMTKRYQELFLSMWK